MSKGRRTSKTMGKEDFTATDGWFNRWKRRENMVYKCLHGEEKSPPTNAQIQDALRILRRGVQYRATNFENTMNMRIILWS